MTNDKLELLDKQLRELRKELEDDLLKYSERCSCGSRQKSKCVRESDSGYGKMCVKELKAERDIQRWSEEFASNQETLPIEFQQILADNIWELYET
jgi:hypothetical protein